MKGVASPAAITVWGGPAGSGACMVSGVLVLGCGIWGESSFERGVFSKYWGFVVRFREMGVFARRVVSWCSEFGFFRKWSSPDGVVLKKSARPRAIWWSGIGLQGAGVGQQGCGFASIGGAWWGASCFVFLVYWVQGSGGTKKSPSRNRGGSWMGSFQYARDLVAA